ncbi:DUF2029 domain-containing protein [Adhaeribacter swui]|uniref:DUF2029 domain-containing protein n=1 Tax=Adhaeribacter swui TaxID=2086471 RepID=A0A7G7GDX6_9BACT|nr:glycosyltransferase 87 family protein [Adhaeribacter swui]QNF35360.1 DUF2029 domain-containing protein [Adhaeribacter swui]
MERKTGISFYLWAFLAVVAYLGLGYLTQRTQFWQVAGWFALAFVAYYKLCRGSYSVKILLLTAVICRLLFLFAWPALSDDYFRFIWDGRLGLAGINPFEQLPSYYVSAPTKITGITPALFHRLNSPEYFSVYPPVCQFIFTAAAWLFPSKGGMVVFMRFVILLAELGNMWLLIKLLQKFKKSGNNVIWYALNPLVIVELTGNLHFEALVLFFLLSSLYLLTQQKMIGAGVLFSLAIGVKLLPLLVMPVLLARLGWRKFLVFGTVVSLTLVLLFLPYASEQLFRNLGESLNLYFQKFEFNASMYYLLRWLGFQLVGYNSIAIIGPFLSLLTCILVVILAYKSRKLSKGQIPIILLLAFSVYFFLATTVHPWYLTTLVALAVLTNYRFPVVWSGLAVLSYATYQTSAYHENLVLVAIEYCLVFGFLLFELQKHKFLKKYIIFILSNNLFFRTDFQHGPD